ncbi:hypothetical protein CHS0354_034196 [Potamilus streckersoni]|uniref:tRNA (cytosine(38)-C(5))-methyltransferase n=1 Tax=Potamilus streckersoni TaxID=2493646 RepID=A0AAE0T331_9BIVA|nr:hypothetical protein CHS0354_034196 [Potamilus streckersoni]
MAASSAPVFHHEKELRVLELYSGIGGMHFALDNTSVLKDKNMKYKVVLAIDINNVANRIYQHNFPVTKMSSSGIEGLTVKKLDKLKIDMILMSPPCQPFTRVGKKMDHEDARSKSLLHLLDLLPRLSHCPSYILVENVKGFETSQTRDILVESLKKCDFTYQEFLLTPLQMGIPNARLRYYLIAKRRQHNSFCFPIKDQVLHDLPECVDHLLVYRQQAEIQDQKVKANTESDMSGKICDQSLIHRDIRFTFNDENDSLVDKPSAECLSNQNVNICETEDQSDVDKSVYKEGTKSKRPKFDNTDGENTEGRVREIISQFIEIENHNEIFRQVEDGEHKSYGPCLQLVHFLETKNKLWDFDKFRVPEKDLKRFIVMDIVNPCSRKSICFTKRYGHFMEGAGSIVQMTSDIQAVKAAADLKAHAVQIQNRDQWQEEEMEIIRRLELRYFTPQEIANLLCFPQSFCFPDDIEIIQLYRLLGNSLNVYVVSILISLMLL